jgi:hypothetical protein
MTGETKHTPAPWIVGNMAEEVFHKSESTYEAIAVRPEDDDTGNWDANARLIAAAPELLAACKLIVQDVALLTRYRSETRYVSAAVVNVCVEAIAKAEGRQ